MAQRGLEFWPCLAKELNRGRSKEDQSALGVALDAGILSLILALVIGQEALEEFRKLCAVVAAVALVNLLLILLIGEPLGVLILLPIAAVDALLLTLTLMYLCGATIKQAAITVILFLVYRIVFQLVIWGR